MTTRKHAAHGHILNIFNSTVCILMRAAREQITDFLLSISRTRSRQEADQKLYTDTGRRVSEHGADATATGFYLLTPVHRPLPGIHYPIFPTISDPSSMKIKFKVGSKAEPKKMALHIDS